MAKNATEGRWTRIGAHIILSFRLPLARPPLSRHNPIRRDSTFVNVTIYTPALLILEAQADLNVAKLESRKACRRALAIPLSARTRSIHRA